MRRNDLNMSFVLRGGWHCQFLEGDLKTALAMKLTLSGEKRIIETAKLGGAVLNLEARQAIDHGISIGRGGLWLDLSKLPAPPG